MRRSNDVKAVEMRKMNTILAIIVFLLIAADAIMMACEVYVEGAPMKNLQIILAATGFGLLVLIINMIFFREKYIYRWLLIVSYAGMFILSFYFSAHPQTIALAMIAGTIIILYHDMAFTIIVELAVVIAIIITSVFLKKAGTFNSTDLLLSIIIAVTYAVLWYMVNIEQQKQTKRDQNVIKEKEEQQKAQIEKLSTASTEMEQRISVINELSDDLKDKMDQADKAVTEIAQGSVRIAEAIQEQSKQSALITELVDNVEASKNKISVSVTESIENSVSGSEQMKKLNEISNVVAEKTNSMAVSMNEMSNEAEIIREITSTIQDIASRTNILALNASIEAARAGQAGKGFSVVAEEIRQLAEQTGLAANNIDQKLSGFLKSIDDMVKDTEQTVSFVDEELVSVKQANESFRSISEKLSATGEDVTSLAKDCDELKVANNAVAAQVMDLSASSEEVAAQSQVTLEFVESSEKATQDVSQNVEELYTIVQDVNK